MFVVLAVVVTCVRFVGDLARRTARSRVSVANDVHKLQNSAQLFSSKKQSCTVVGIRPMSSRLRLAEGFHPIRPAFLRRIKMGFYRTVLRCVVDVEAEVEHSEWCGHQRYCRCHGLRRVKYGSLWHGADVVRSRTPPQCSRPARSLVVWNDHRVEEETQSLSQHC